MNFLIELMNTYFQTKGKNIYIFNTFFYPKLREGVRHVKKWLKTAMKNQNRKAYPATMFVPVHLPEEKHWALVVAHVCEHEIEYMDSMCTESAGPNQHTTRVQQYVDAQYADAKEYDRRQGWIHRTVATPQQKASFDCGLFVLKNIEHVCWGQKLAYSQQDMVSFRKQCILRILNKKLEY